MTPTGSGPQAAGRTRSRAGADHGVSLRGGSPHYGAGDAAIMSELGHVIEQLAGRGHQVALLFQADCSDCRYRPHMADALVEAVPVRPDDRSVRCCMIPPLNTGSCCRPSWPRSTSRWRCAITLPCCAWRRARCRYVLHYSNKGEDLCRRLRQPGAPLGGGTAGIDIQRHRTLRRQRLQPASHRS